MSIFSASIQHRSFYWQISILCFVLGLLLAAAAHTTSSISRTGNAVNRVGFYSNVNSANSVNAKKLTELESELDRRNKRITELENQVAQESGRATVIAELNRELQEMKFLAGQTEAIGPGVQVTLVDSKKKPLLPTDEMRQSNLIHDFDMLSIINELKASGAEALAINGKRIIGTTPVRCVGPVVLVNNIPTPPPYVIQAIGDATAMISALNLEGGVLAEIRRYDQSMVRVEKKDKLTLPAYAGKTQPAYAKAPKAPAAKEKKDEDR